MVCFTKGGDKIGYYGHFGGLWLAALTIRPKTLEFYYETYTNNR